VSSISGLKIGVIFGSRLALPSEALRKEVSEEFVKRYERYVNEIKNVLETSFPTIEFAYGVVSTSSDAMDVVDKMRDVAGYLVFAFEHPTGYLRTIMRSGKPTIVIAYTYVGAGELLQSYSKAIKEGYPVIGVAVRDVSNPDRIRRYIKYFEVIHKLKSSKILLIVSPVVKQYLDTGYPLAVDIYSMMSDVYRVVGVKTSAMDIEHFKRNYYDKVSEKEAEKWAEKWFNEAKDIILHSKEELIEPAKFYVALKKLIAELNLDAVGIDCITLYHSGLLKTWPCLAFMELTKEGIVCGCEADLYSMVVMLLMKFLANVTGFINDPSPDMDKGEILYYHCYAPVNFYGYDSKKLLPFSIVPAHWGLKKLSIRVDFEPNTITTSIGFDPKRRELLIHTANIISNEYGPEECATKVKGKVDVRYILDKWNPEAGWHRVLFYGDHREDLKYIAKLLKLKVVEEDKE